MKNALKLTAALFAFFALAACEKASDISYPYQDHGIVYMGLKSGLTSSSSDSAFSAGLNEILQKHIADNPSSSTEMTFDGYRYEMTNLQQTTGGVSNAIWDLFWSDLNRFGYSVGSCWGFTYMEIPARGKVGTGHVIYAIVTNAYKYSEEVSYFSYRATINPKGKTRTGDEFVLPGNFPEELSTKTRKR